MRKEKKITTENTEKEKTKETGEPELEKQIV
jgi:hypothetical protein